MMIYTTNIEPVVWPHHVVVQDWHDYSFREVVGRLREEAATRYPYQRCELTIYGRKNKVVFRKIVFAKPKKESEVA